MRIGLLTGGGDCPGLNAALRAVVLVADERGDTVLGFHHGWRGVVEDDCQALGARDTAGMLHHGGTMLHTARYHPHEHPGGIDAVLRAFWRNRLDVFIVIGGDGTLGAADVVAQTGLPVVGIPKTIDNDVQGTDRCVGFDTAVATATEAIDRVETTAESHDRLMVVEVMGRSTGWLALAAGLASGADAICLPERETDLDAVAKALRRRHDRGATSSVVVVAEGARLREQPTATGSPGVVVAAELGQRTAYETRVTVLGHVQRGGSPVASDRILATAFGVAAVEAAHAGAGEAMVCVREDRVELAPLAAVRLGPRPVSPELLAVADALAIAS